MRSSKRKTLKSAVSLLGLGIAATLLFSVFRARRLLANSREIAAQSAGFSRDYFVGDGPLLTYLAMGDSTVAGFGAADLHATAPRQIAGAIAARGFRVHVVNVAVGGATLGDVLQHQSQFLRTIKPDLVTLSAGANNATHRTSDADFRRELSALFAAFSRSNARLVLVANVPDMRLAPALPLPIALFCGGRARALNAVLMAQKRDDKIEIVDLFGRGKLDFGRDAGLYAADLFHPSGRGYEVWARLFVQKLQFGAFGAAARR